MCLGASVLLSSCDLSQIPGLDKRLSPEDSKAIGAACRHSGRALEDCFKLNMAAHQAGVFEGWRDMNDYMIANKIETVVPQIQASSFGGRDSTSHGEEAHAEKDAAAPKSEPSQPSTDARARWTPPGVETATVTKTEEPATHGSSPTAAKEVPATPTAPPASSEPSPSRPWERKKDSKNHT